jgi:hypothetical protein
MKLGEAISTKLKANMKSYTQAELTSFNDIVSKALWAKFFRMNKVMLSQKTSFIETSKQQ